MIKPRSTPLPPKSTATIKPRPGWTPLKPCLTDMTDESALAYRQRLLQSGQLTAYVPSTNDYGFDRPALSSANVLKLRDAYIRAGLLTPNLERDEDETVH